MPRKTYSKSGRFCRVTFEVPGDAKAFQAALCGDFNAWSPTAHRMAQRKDGRFSVTLSLECGRSYCYKYLLDNSIWENDRDADRYHPNPFGTEDSILDL